MVNAAEDHSLMQQEQMAFFDAFCCHIAFCADSRLLYLSFVESTCFLLVNISWIPRYKTLFVRSVTSLLKETAGIACCTALLLRVHHRAYTMLGLIHTLSLDTVVTFLSSSWTVVTAVWKSLAVL